MEEEKGELFVQKTGEYVVQDLDQLKQEMEHLIESKIGEKVTILLDYFDDEYPDTCVFIKGKVLEELEVIWKKIENAFGVPFGEISVLANVLISLLLGKEISTARTYFEGIHPYILVRL